MALREGRQPWPWGCLCVPENSRKGQRLLHAGDSSECPEGPPWEFGPSSGPDILGMSPLPAMLPILARLALGALLVLEMHFRSGAITLFLQWQLSLPPGGWPTAEGRQRPREGSAWGLRRVLSLDAPLPQGHKAWGKTGPAAGRSRAVHPAPLFSDLREGLVGTRGWQGGASAPRT